MITTPEIELQGESPLGSDSCSPSWPLEPWIGNCPKCKIAYRTNPPLDTSRPLEIKCGRMDCDEMIRMTPIEGWPEPDNDTEAELAAWELLRDTRAELEELRAAVRNMRDAKGRFHTQLAVERLIALLPKNVQPSHGRT